MNKLHYFAIKINENYGLWIFVLCCGHDDILERYDYSDYENKIVILILKNQIFTCENHTMNVLLKCRKNV